MTPVKKAVESSRYNYLYYSHRMQELGDTIHGQIDFHSYCFTVMSMFPFASVFFTILQAILQKLENNEIKGIKGYSNTKKVRNSHLQMFFKKGVLKNFAIFAGKYLCWSLFLIKVFYCEHYEIFKNNYFEEHCELLLLEEG